MSDSRQLVLEVRDLAVGFMGSRLVQVTEGVSFEIHRGEVFALVGESGCGKSVTAMALLRLLPVPGARILGGSVKLNGLSLLQLPMRELRKIRGHQACCVFQEPMQALNPVLTIGAQLREALRDVADSEADSRISEILRMAGFNDAQRVQDSYPHEMSGGMLQRIVICMALLPRPALLIADEPTTALDVTVQAQVMEILRDLCSRLGTAVLLITHNMGLVAQYADRLGVMYAGRMVESAPVEELLNNPMHPYTRGLLAAVPEKHAAVGSMQPIAGSVPAPSDFDEGCRFRFRCPLATERCTARPLPVGGAHWALCFYPGVVHG